MTDKARDPIALTEEQTGYLADLVSLAMIGFSLVKQHGAVPMDNPALASFLPLVQDDLNARRDAQLQQAALKYGMHDDLEPI